MKHLRIAALTLVAISLANIVAQYLGDGSINASESRQYSFG